MSDKTKLRDRLVGVSSYTPPGNAYPESRFSSAKEYASFLADTRNDPDTFWMNIASGLIWDNVPGGAGGPGDWFKDGTLNIHTNCLLGDRSAGSEEERVLVYDMESRSSRPFGNKEIMVQVEIVAGWIGSWGLQPGDRVLVATFRPHKALVALLACLRLGLTCVPMDVTRSLDRIPRRSRDAKCKAAVVDPSNGFKDDLDVSHYLELSDDLSSSGHSPKNVSVGSMHPAFVLADSAGQLFTIPTAGFLVQAVSAYQYLLEGGAGQDRMWLMMPCHYASFLSVAFGALCCEGQIGLVQSASGYRAEDLIEALTGVAVKTVIADTKTLMRLVEPAMKDGYQPLLDGPKTLVMEGEVVEPRVWAYVRKGLFDGQTHVVQMLSRPESGGFVAGPNVAVTPVRYSSVSLAAPGIHLAVVHTKGGVCGPGEGGLLCLERPNPGLALELQELEMPLAIEVKARQDQEGYFWPMGEVKIERKKKGVSIPELEGMIVSIEGVEMAAVIRHPDSKGNLKACAFIQPSSDDSDDLVASIQKEILEQYGSDAVPDRFQVVEQLPYSRTGKLRRSLLREFSEDPDCQDF